MIFIHNLNMCDFSIKIGWGLLLYLMLSKYEGMSFMRSFLIKQTILLAKCT